MAESVFVLPHAENAKVKPTTRNHEGFNFGGNEHEVPLAFVNFGSSWLQNPNMPKACISKNMQRKI